MKKWHGIFILIAFMVFINGCAITSHGRIAKIEHKQVDAIKIGETTKEDVVKLLGKPQNIVYKPNGVEVFVYQHGVERSVGIPFIISWSRTSGTGQTFSVSFKDGAVIDYEFTTDDRGMVE